MSSTADNRESVKRSSDSFDIRTQNVMNVIPMISDLMQSKVAINVALSSTRKQNDSETTVSDNSSGHEELELTLVTNKMNQVLSENRISSNRIEDDSDEKYADTSIKDDYFLSTKHDTIEEFLEEESKVKTIEFPDAFDTLLSFVALRYLAYRAVSPRKLALRIEEVTSKRISEKIEDIEANRSREKENMEKRRKDFKRYLNFLMKFLILLLLALLILTTATATTSSSSGDSVAPTVAPTLSPSAVVFVPDIRIKPAVTNIFFLYLPLVQFTLVSLTFLYWNVTENMSFVTVYDIECFISAKAAIAYVDFCWLLFFFVKCSIFVKCSSTDRQFCGFLSMVPFLVTWAICVSIYVPSLRLSFGGTFGTISVFFFVTLYRQYLQRIKKIQLIQDKLLHAAKTKKLSSEIYCRSLHMIDTISRSFFQSESLLLLLAVINAAILYVYLMMVFLIPRQHPYYILYLLYAGMVIYGKEILFFFLIIWNGTEIGRMHKQLVTELTKVSWGDPFTAEETQRTALCLTVLGNPIEFNVYLFDGFGLLVRSITNEYGTAVLSTLITAKCIVQSLLKDAAYLPSLLLGCVKIDRKWYCCSNTFNELIHIWMYLYGWIKFMGYTLYILIILIITSFLIVLFTALTIPFLLLVVLFAIPVAYIIKYPLHIYIVNWYFRLANKIIETSEILLSPFVEKFKAFNKESIMDMHLCISLTRDSYYQTLVIYILTGVISIFLTFFEWKEELIKIFFEDY